MAPSPPPPPPRQHKCVTEAEGRLSKRLAQVFTAGHERYVLSWRLSNTLDTEYCLNAVDEALTQGAPEIFNTDQGAQFTSRDLTSKLEEKSIAIRQDGKGRAFDNVMIERLWRTVKYEEVYLMEYSGGADCHQSLGDYFKFYCRERRHQSLNRQTPWEVYRPTRLKRRQAPI